MGIGPAGPQMDSPVLGGGGGGVSHLLSMSVPAHARSGFHFIAQRAGTGTDCSMEPTLLAAIVSDENFVANVGAGAGGRWACICLTFPELCRQCWSWCGWQVGVYLLDISRTLSPMLELVRVAGGRVSA